MIRATRLLNSPLLKGARPARHIRFTSLSTVSRTAGRGRAEALPPVAKPQQPLALLHATPGSTRPYATTEPPKKGPTPRPFKPRPDEITTTSSTRPVFEPSNEVPGDYKPSEKLKSELKTVKETLALDSVPRHPYIFGIAGTLPYVATSLSTLVLSWNITATWPTKWSLVNTFMLWPENAREWLHVMEHIQLGYGAVLISFLGAVHWGLELAEKTPSYPRTSTRYIASFVAPLVAWPTILMPVIYALIAQFTALTALYLFDARAAQQGWAPGWYPTYRFVLTAIVGGAIAAALIGRARIDAGISETVEDAGSAALNLKAMRERIVNPKGIEGRHGEKGRYVNWERLEEEERQRRREKEAKKKKEEEEAEKGAEEKGKEKDGDKKEVKDSGNGESKKKDGVDEKAHEKADGGSNKEKKDKESKK